MKTALAHRLEDKYGHGTDDAAANPREVLAMVASATRAARLDGRVSGSKWLVRKAWRRASGGAGIRAEQPLALSSTWAAVIPKDMSAEIDAHGPVVPIGAISSLGVEELVARACRSQLRHRWLRAEVGIVGAHV